MIFTLPSWPWACLMRVDMLAMLLSFAGIALFIAGGRRMPIALLAFLFFVAALFTKQTMVAGPLACGVLLLLESPRRFAITAVLASAAALGTLAALQVVTHGYYLTNIISYNRNVFMPGQLLRFELEHLESSGPVVAASLFLPALFLLRTPPARMLPRLRLLLRRSLFTRLLAVATGVLIVATAVTVTAGKQGANYNYFLEMDLACALGAGVFSGWLLQRGVHRAQLALFATIILALHCTRVEPRIYTALTAGRDPAPRYAAEVVNVLRNTAGRVYSEDMTVLMEAGKEIEAEPAIISTLALAGKWDEQPFVMSIEGGEMSLIVLSTTLENKDRFTPRVADAIRSRYKLGRKIGQYSLYEPR